MEKSQLPEEMPEGKPKEVENLREEMRPTPKKTKFGRKAIEDNESTKEMDEEMNFENSYDRYISYFYEMFYHFTNFTKFLQVKKDGGKLSGGTERAFSKRENA